MDDPKRAGDLMLRLDAFSVSRGGQAVVRDVNVIFADGEVHGLVGRNGAGKTTLLDAIAQLIVPDGGTVTLDGARLASENVAYVPSTLTFLPFVTVQEYLRAFNESRRRRDRGAADIAEWCRTFDIPPDADAGDLIPLACDRAYLLAEGRIMQDLPASPPPDLRSLLAAPGLDERARVAAHLASSL